MFSALDGKLDELDRKLDRLASKFDGIALKIDRLEGKVDALARDFPPIVGDAMREVLREERDRGSAARAAVPL